MPAKMDAFTGDLSLRYFVDSGGGGQDDDSPSAGAAARRTPQSSSRRQLSCRKKATVPASPGFNVPALSADDSALMDTSLGDVSNTLTKSPAKATNASSNSSPRKSARQPPRTGASPLKNFYFTTDLRRISEVPTATPGDDTFLVDLDTSELERLAAWETAQLDQNALKSSTASSSGDGSKSSSLRPSRSKLSELSSLQEDSAEHENIAPFVQLGRGRSRSRSPRKARPSAALPSREDVEPIPEVIQPVPEPASTQPILTSSAQAAKRPAAEDVAGPPTKASKKASLISKPPSQGTASVTQSSVKTSRSSVPRKPSSSREASRLASSSSSDALSSSIFSSDKDVGGSGPMPTSAALEPTLAPSAGDEKQRASVSPKRRIAKAQSRQPSTSPTKLPTRRGSRVSLVAAAEPREERRRRLGLSTKSKEELASSAVPIEMPAEAAVEAAATSPDPRSLLPSTPPLTQSEDGQVEIPVTPSEQQPEVQTLAEQQRRSPPAEAVPPSQEAPAASRTTRRRSARLSLKGESSPRDPTGAPATEPKPFKPKATTRKPLRPSLTIPTTAVAKKEAAVQRSAVAQARKAASAAPSVTARIPAVTGRKVQATPPVAPSQSATSDKDSTGASASSAAPGGRVLRNRKSLVAPPAVPTTVIGGKFRQMANGELVPITSLEAAGFQLSTDARGAQHATIARQRLEKQEEERKRKAAYKANPIPEWMRKRKQELEREEEERLQAELEEARQQELTRQKKKRVAASSLAADRGARSPKKQKTVAVPFVSSVDARLAERQRWEDKRRRKEALIEAEREKARREREAKEEEEYREARKRTVVKANPLPGYLNYAVSNAAASSETQTQQTRSSARTRRSD
ncbi:uncharacterized protein PFL1_01882 [Pseudozyma flocculosa PF-1]|uniref:TPX2 C-terminal domain-containing protein n=1 Tax=Pseudozyma flocculosa TaxID=84751 RepID=A0A5C3F0J2_9BASI|nr:uncharacterized protein PFL1_01882 [Pseudozyma flocculosa PF-1]EPQ30356.1 hypothetical protein PFL1_01882 [Pseudozyma flocculosa PF-1]SPO37426.1 uncharacterized protein PSFLO_02899 [Pseudozyma flocculosa]